MNRDRTRQLSIVVAVLATVAINVLANALPLNGQNTGEISDRFDVFFVPAAYVFLIWFVIYLALLVYAIYQALPAQRENPRLRSIGGPFLFGAVANIAWLFFWHYEIFPLTLLAMVALLLSLIVVYLRLGTGRTRTSTAERWAVRVPFSIYLGWITVATIANTTWLLDYWNWSGWGISPETWTVIMLAAAVLIATAMSITRRDVAYLLVLVWAIAGIAVKHADTSLVATASWVAAVLVALLALLALWNRRRQAIALAT